MNPLAAEEALEQLGGIASTREVLALSSRSRLRTAIRRGRVLRIGRGRLALPRVDSSLRMAELANGHLSHLSAALHHGWKVQELPDLAQVILPPGTNAPDGQDGLIAEVRHRKLTSDDRDGWATSPLRTVLDCAADLPFSDALCVADSALRAGAVTQDELLAAASPRQRRVATYADGRAANPFESALRAICIEISLEMVPQYAITCGDITFHPDLANPLLGLAVEADSYSFHGRDPRDHERDVERYNALVRHGWAVLRFTWDQVMRNPAYVVRTLHGWLTRPELRQK